ncbi:DUF4339 domain-containing protein [Flavobacterium akiainvivens]|uniref:DUF4339 domain-containing protein n=1 Tax=Flavobacterium akiainvivens TaxID=1202724 RepID=UPI0006C877F1|nr:DUF4339 domain-containing protein [Flavobacterium akiainvivens]SFQ71980.1 protein of unknown function [Flavobacterium akiainvivens]
MKKYYAHDGAVSKGPFTIQELKDKGIKRATPVWTEGMADWVSAGTLDELKELFATPPPFNATPPPYQAAQQPVQETHQTFEPEKEYTPIRKRLWFKVTFTVTLCVFAIILFGNMSKGSGYEPDTFAEPELTPAQLEAQNPQNYLNAGGGYHENFLGDKLKIEGYIENKATVTNYKDAVIQVTFYSKTHSPVNTEEYVIYEYFPHGTNKEFKLKVNNYSNIESIGWKVINAKVMK